MPRAKRPPDTPLDEWLLRFRHIDENGCWNWTRGGLSTGYGVINARELGGSMLVHRLAYELWRGPAGDLCVLHHCDNPPCFNPEHLFLGTRADNDADCRRKNRQAPLPTGPSPVQRARGERHGNAKYSEETIRAVRAHPGTQRQISEDLGIPVGTVGGIKNGHAWKHVV